MDKDNEINDLATQEFWTRRVLGVIFGALGSVSAPVFIVLLLVNDKKNIDIISILIVLFVVSVIVLFVNINILKKH